MLGVKWGDRMNEYIKRLTELGFVVVEASVSELLGWWHIRAEDPYGYLHEWFVDPCAGPVVDPEDDLPEEVWEAF